MTVVPFFFLFIHLCPIPSFSPALPPPSSCPWVIHVSSLASPFPILFLTSPCLFCTYHSCFLLPAPFPPSSPLPLSTDNPPCDLHFCDCFCSSCLISLFLFMGFFLGSVVDSCEFLHFNVRFDLLFLFSLSIFY